MKRIVVPISIIFLSVLTFGQSTPIEFLNALPKPPSGPCGMSIEQKMQFLDDIARFDTIYRAKMDEYQQVNEQFQEEHQDEATINTLIKAGYSREDAEKMKNLDNMSDEEQAALANQVMLNQYNMTLSEAKKVADYDTAAQQRWAKAQSTMIMAEVQIDPEQNTKKQLEIKNDIELQQDIKWLQNKLRAGENKYFEKIRVIDIEADSARSQMDTEIEKLYKDLNDGNGNSAQIIDQIVSLRKKYCGKFTPRYLETVEGYKGYITEHFQEYYKLEELQMTSLERQVGMRNPDYKPGMLPLGMVGSCMKLVSDIFKYNLNTGIGAQFIGY